MESIILSLFFRPFRATSFGVTGNGPDGGMGWQKDYKGEFFKIISKLKIENFNTSRWHTVKPGSGKSE